MTRRLSAPKASAVVALGATCLAVASTGVAYAYVRVGASGSVSGSATTEPARSIGFTVTAPSTAQLYPGASGDVTVNLTNPYAQPITLTGVTGSVGTNHDGCTNADFSVAPKPSGLPATMTANQSLTGVVLSSVITMHNDAADACRGAAITLTLSVTGQL